MFYKTSVKHLSEKMPSANSRHLTSELMPPPQTRPNRRCRPQNTDMKQATSIVDVSSYSPSPPRRQQFNMSSDHQHRIVASTGFEPVVEDSDAESEGHKNSGVCSDLERQHSYVELKDSAVAQRTQAQPQRTNFMEAVAASNSLSSTDRGSLPGVQVSSSPPRAAAPKPAIADMVTGSNPPQPVTFVHEQEESTCNHETRDYSSDISSLSDYSPCSSEDEESRRVADTKRPTTSSHHLSSSDHKNLYESEGEDVVVKSAHGKPLTRRSKVIITDTDRRRRKCHF